MSKTGLKEGLGTAFPQNGVPNGTRYPVELKLLTGPKAREEGAAQLAAYCDLCGAREGWLVLFDHTPGHSWDDRISWETRQDAAGRILHLVGC